MALFLCDRDELRLQGLNAFKNLFGSDAAEVYRKPDGKNFASNARVHIATYQTLGIESEDDVSNFLDDFYPENTFSHIIIDECHRSAWGKWSRILTKNPDAVHIGLTATPRKLIESKTNEENQDAVISGNNFKYFGEPVYEYDISQGIEDGYLAACEVIKSKVDVDNTGLTIEDVFALKPKNFITGQPLSLAELKDIYEKQDFEKKLLYCDYC